MEYIAADKIKEIFRITSKELDLLLKKLNITDLYYNAYSNCFLFNKEQVNSVQEELKKKHETNPTILWEV